MKKSLIVATLLLPTISIMALDSIYDGTGSLINSTQQCWGCDKDEARMHPHKNKNSTVTFQVLKNPLSCDHIDIHSDIDLGQDVQINLKSWHQTTVQHSYRTSLPVGSYNSKNGVSLDMKKNSWTTLAVSTTKPLSKTVSIYAYCRNSTDTLNTSFLETISPQMTILDNAHKHLGNGSLITESKDNGQGGFGIRKDTAVSSKIDNAETSFQIFTNKDTCSQVTINGTSSDVEQVLVKGWDKEKWTPSTCNKFPCVIDSYFRSDDTSTYMLINVKTKANQSNSKLYANCGKKAVKFELKEKYSQPKHPNNCKFNDVPKNDWSDYKYITALCSAGILEGYGHTGYTEFGPTNPTLWSELTKVVNLADNFYKTKKIRNKYPLTPWYDAYVNIAKEQGFDYSNNPQFEVKRGLAFKYIVKVFWNKDLSEEDSATFLSNKSISHSSNTAKVLTRESMARLVLKSANISALESSVERKIPYINHDNNDLDIDKKIELVEPSFKTPNKADSMEKKEEVFTSNIEDAIKEDNTVSEKDTTNNTGLVIESMGGEESIKDNFKNKETTEEFIDEIKSQDITIPINNESKIKEDSIVIIEEKSTGEKIVVSTISKKDSEGNAKMGMETSSGNIEEVDRKTLEENGYEVKEQVLVEKIMKKEDS